MESTVTKRTNGDEKEAQQGTSGQVTSVPGTIVIRNNCAREQYDNNQARTRGGKKCAGNKRGKENCVLGNIYLDSS